MPEIVRLARERRRRGRMPALADDLDAMAKALEMHMFTVKMRPFPMMEQGGDTLVTHPIDDLRQHAQLEDETLFPMFADWAARSQGAITGERARLQPSAR